MQISFIIPLYNCASTIERCLTSIFSLSMPPGSYEIIVVDDGSKDDGPKVVQRIATGHRQVRLVSQPNRGASSARNRGLELARGEYVWFVDADDKVLPDVQSIELINQYPDAEIIAFNYIRLAADGKEEKNVIYDADKALTGLEQMKTYNLYLWNKLFRRSVIGDVRFVDGTVNQEDMFFCLQVLVKTRYVQGVNLFGYLYDCTSSTSTTRCTSLRHYVKNYQDSVLIQGSIKRMADSIEDGQLRHQLMEIDNLCVINHFYIILRWYGYNRLKKAIKDYGNLGLYPLGKCGDARKNLFRRFANNKTLLLLVSRIINLF
jgi:glycosyltransferase involved in cell wall biosynthesis